MKLSTAFRWTARILGSFIAIYWLFTGVMSAIYGKEPISGQAIFMIFFIIATAFSFTIAWWHEKLGGTAAVITGLTQSIFAYSVSGQSKWIAVMIAGVPILLAGLLYLLVVFLERKKPSAAESDN